MNAYIIDNRQRLMTVMDINPGAQTIVRADYALLSEAFLTGYMADHRLANIADTLAALGITANSEAGFGL